MKIEHAETRVAIAALLNLIRLLGVQIVTGRRPIPFEELEAAIRRKVAGLRVPGASETERAGGLRLAQVLVGRALIAIRAQSEAIERGEGRGESVRPPTRMH